MIELGPAPSVMLANIPGEANVHTTDLWYNGTQPMSGTFKCLHRTFGWWFVVFIRTACHTKFDWLSIADVQEVRGSLSVEFLSKRFCERLC